MYDIVSFMEKFGIIIYEKKSSFKLVFFIIFHNLIMKESGGLII